MQIKKFISQSLNLLNMAIILIAQGETILKLPIRAFLYRTIEMGICPFFRISHFLILSKQIEHNRWKFNKFNKHFQMRKSFPFNHWRSKTRENSKQFEQNVRVILRNIFTRI